MNIRMSARLALTLAIALPLSAALVTAAPAVAASVATVPAGHTTTDGATCRADLLIVSLWSTGFTGQVNVTNTSKVPIHWQVTITFPGGSITPPPGYIVLRDGASWLVYPPPGAWNGTLPVGGSASFGFVGSYAGTFTPPVVTCVATPV